MTRFARAKGSKASNEKAPEDSTPWEVMKNQLLQAKKNNEEETKRQEAEKQRLENYESFLKEQKIQKRKATWCTFPEDEHDNKKAKNNKAKHDIEGDIITKKSKHNFNDESVKSVAHSSKKKLNKKKKHMKTPSGDSHDANQINLTADDKDKISENEIIGDDMNMECKNRGVQQDETNKRVKRKKAHKKKKATHESINVSDTVNNKKNETKNDSLVNEKKEDVSQTQMINKSLKKKKNKKFVDGKPVRRKAINDRSFQIIINGKEMELIRFDGFPILKKDAERLQELKSSMIKKGIPKSEVQRTMKLERRRAEKSLARMKRDVCYNCRKGGHNLSDCPDLKSNIPRVNAAEGICFKCGSTEHRQFECKVQKDKEFKFATCFICKEPGHIARQCPDNPKGLYPNGGCCKLCGDVTHLRKDCPTVKDKKEGTSIKLQTLDSMHNLEDIQQQNTRGFSEESAKKPKKIKF